MFHVIQKSFSACLLAGAVVLLIGGCTNKYASDLTPELDLYSESGEQASLRQSRIVDNNGRLISEDLAKVFLFKEGSQLTRFPVP
ncbi:MAG: hypothetical protein AAF333_05830 [Planctomycetota bacterium]